MDNQETRRAMALAMRASDKAVQALDELGITASRAAFYMDKISLALRYGLHDSVSKIKQRVRRGDITAIEAQVILTMAEQRGVYIKPELWSWVRVRVRKFVSNP